MREERLQNIRRAAGLPEAVHPGILRAERKTMFKVTFRFENGSAVEAFAAEGENLLEVARRMLPSMHRALEMQPAESVE